jgi:hypothetical protein
VEDNDIGVPAGSSRRARVLRDALETMARDGSPELRELATEVLAGRTTLRQAMLSGAYSEQVAAAGERFAAWYNDLDPAERQTYLDAGRAALRGEDARG